MGDPCGKKSHPVTTSVLNSLPMSDDRGPQRLRVGVLGSGAEGAYWASDLGGRGVDVVFFKDLDALLEAQVGLAVVVANATEAARLAAQVARRPDSPPFALLVSSGTQAHPHLRLVESLLKGKNEWERTFDAIVDPVALIDRQGTVVRANLGLARVLARPIGEIIGTPYPVLLGPPGPGSADPIAASVAEGEPRTEEVRFANLPGVQQVTTSPYKDADGALQGAVVILKDVNDIKEQQERMQQASRLADIGQLAAGVAHEINTPLASIALRAESLLKVAGDPRLQAVDAFKNFPRYLRTIDEEIFRCKKIISALLEFSRRRPPEVRETDLNALAERAADLVGHQLKLKQIALALRLEPQLPHIRADDDQLRQALIALLMNAGDATPAGGRIEVETRKSGDHEVTFSVTDNGVGIPRENLDRIFSPFFTTKPVGQGTGLGLALCHGIVTAHGGAILVESDPGKGSRFSLVLPIRGPETPSS
jgi:two-component system NtrC family sensor kinase